MTWHSSDAIRAFQVEVSTNNANTNAFNSFIHSSLSFVHSLRRFLYSASLRLLLLSAPNPCMAKKNSFQARVECARMNPWEQSLRQRKSIPHGRSNHWECTGLPCGRMNKRTIMMKSTNNRIDSLCNSRKTSSTSDIVLLMISSFWPHHLMNYKNSLTRWKCSKKICHV